MEPWRGHLLGFHRTFIYVSYLELFSTPWHPLGPQNTYENHYKNIGFWAGGGAPGSAKKLQIAYKYKGSVETLVFTEPLYM